MSSLLNFGKSKGKEENNEIFTVTHKNLYIREPVTSRTPSLKVYVESVERNKVNIKPHFIMCDNLTVCTYRLLGLLKWRAHCYFFPFTMSVD